MSSVSRSVRNVFRNKARTLVVILIIGVSIAVFLSMTIVNANIGDRTMNISENLDTTITVQPAGSFGPMNSKTLDESIIPTVGSTAHVLEVQVLAMSMQSETTSGTRQDFRPPDDGSGRPNMRVGAMIMGEYPSKNIVLFSGGTLEISSGRTLGSQDTSQAVAVVGENYSETNSVSVGSSISLNGTAFSIVGVYTSGSDFGDNGVIIPYELFKTTYAVDGPNTLYVRVDSVGNVDSVVQTLKDTLGSDYDVVPASEMGRGMQESIDSISANSELGSIVALITAAVVMIFVMILVTRERIKEIGVMKAIGFKNSRIMSQFLTESITLAAIGFVVGIIITVTAGPFISSALLGTSSSTSFGDRPGPPRGGDSSFVAQMDFTLTFDLLAYTFILAIMLGIIGSLYPIIKAMRLKPAEALRYDE
jgi:putative ABC transport system permease protein